jgi:hypothetical protein
MVIKNQSYDHLHTQLFFFRPKYFKMKTMTPGIRKIAYFFAKKSAPKIRKNVNIEPKICPAHRPDLFDGDAALDMLDTSLTPSALKKISKSVMDLSNMTEMQEISKSTSNLMTGSLFTKSIFRKRIKTMAAATSKTSLLRSSVESLATIEVRRARLTADSRVGLG